MSVQTEDFRRIYTMRIKIGPCFTELRDPTPEEKAIITELCTIRSTQHIRMKWEMHGRDVEVTRRFYRNGKVPSGLLPRLVAGGIKLEVESQPEFPKAGAPYPLTLPPLPVSEADFGFQTEAVQKAVSKGRGLLWCPTGAGKTVIAAKLIATLGLKTVVVVPSLELAHQTHQKFQQYFRETQIGRLDGATPLNKTCPILIATEQSLWAYHTGAPDAFKDWVSTIQVLVIDECHHVNTAAAKGKDKKILANTWWEVAMAIPASYRFGVSATMNTEDSPNNQFILESATGRIIYHISVSELIQRKVLVPMTITMYRREATPCKIWKTRTMGGIVVDGAYDVNIIDAMDRNMKIVQLATDLNRKGKKVLVLVDLVDRHGELLAKLIPNSVFLAGKHNRDDRDFGIEQFVKQNKVLISTIVKEGFDVPAIDSVIIAGGGKSHKKLIQMLGRARRITHGKDRAEVWDFFDDDGEGALGPRMCARHSLERLKIYKSVPEDTVMLVEMKPCP